MTSTLDRSRALWNRSKLDLRSEETLAQILDRGDLDDWRALYRLAQQDADLRTRLNRVILRVPLGYPHFWRLALRSVGESVDLDVPLTEDRESARRRHTELCFTTIAGGDSRFVREVAVSFAESLEAAFAAHGVQEDRSWTEDEMLHIDQRPKADLGSGASFVGLLIFLSGWAANKLLDEIYEKSLGPAIRKKLDTLVRTGRKGIGRRGESAFLFGVWFQDSRLLVLVLVPGDHLSDVSASRVQLTEVLARGVRFAVATRATGVIHTYVIDNSAAEGPRMYRDLEEALIKEGWI